MGDGYICPSYSTVPKLSYGSLQLVIRRRRQLVGRIDAEMLEGGTEEIIEKLIEILKAKGGIK